MNKTEIKEMMGDISEVTGVEPDWELVHGWDRVGDEPSTMEQCVVHDRNSGLEYTCVRTALEEQERLAAIEVVRDEARAALDDADIPRTADGILWLAAVHEDSSLSALESLSYSDVARLNPDYVEPEVAVVDEPASPHLTVDDIKASRVANDRLASLAAHPSAVKVALSEDEIAASQAANERLFIPSQATAPVLTAEEIAESQRINETMTGKVTL